MSFTIAILSFYLPIQARKEGFGHFLHCLPVPSALLPENPSRLEGRMEAYICKSAGGCMQRYRQGHCGKTRQGCWVWNGMPCDPEQHLFPLLHRVNSNSTNSYASISIYQDKASQANSSSKYKDVLVTGKLLPPSF